MDQAIENLISAIEKGRTDIVRTIVSACEQCENEKEGEINLDRILNSVTTPFGSVLHLATKLGDPDVVRTLLAGGADPAVRNNEGLTALELTENAKVHRVFSEELLQCTAQANVPRVAQLVAAGVSVNLLDSPTSRNSPLHWAASYGNKEVVQCLCERSAGVDVINADGATPLHDAFNRGDLEIMEELLQAGASVMIRPIDGKFAGQSLMDLAEDEPEVMALIEKYKNHKPAINGHMDGNLSESDVSEIGKPNSVMVNGVDDAGLPGTPLLQGPEHNLAKTLADVLTFPSVTSPPDSLVTDGRLNLLWPKPQRLLQRDGAPFKPSSLLLVYATIQPQDDLHAVCDTWHRCMCTVVDLEFELIVQPYLTDKLTETLSGPDPYILCEINPQLFTRKEAYSLSVSNKMVKLQAGDSSGLFYGISTFLQLLRLCQEEGIPPLQIHDWPCLRDRGVLLDFSKGRLPTLETLRHIINILSTLKINQLQLYMRFQSVSEVGGDKWQLPYSPSELMNVHWLCKHVHIKVVPVLDVVASVNYEDLPALREPFSKFLKCYSAVDTVGVGPRLSSLLMDVDEHGRLSLDDVTRLLPIYSHQVPQLCAFIFHDSPDLLTQFPFNMKLVEYGFQANYDFEKLSKIYMENGVPFSVMPGTAAWNSVAGCPEAAVTNVHLAVTSAVAQGALGMIIAHWAGIGHITHQPLSWPGYVTAGGLAWNSSIRLDFMHSNLHELMSHHIYLDETGILGKVVIQLGRAETYILRCAHNQQGTDLSNLPAEKGSTLYKLLMQPDQVPLENLTPDVFQRAIRHIRQCQNELLKAKPECEQAEEIVHELQLTADLMLAACKIGRSLVLAGKNPTGSAGYAVVNMGMSNLPPTHKTDLANRILSHMDTYRQLWKKRHLEDSLEESAQMLENVVENMLPAEQRPKEMNHS